jgi:hypothetical protein
MKENNLCYGLIALRRKRREAHFNSPGATMWKPCNCRLYPIPTDMLAGLLPLGNPPTGWALHHSVRKNRLALVG